MSEHARRSQGPPRLGVVVSMFPELHETFILRELVALERRGIDFDVFSLQRPRDPITLDDAIRLSRERTFYSGLLTPATLGAVARAASRHPLRLAAALARVVWLGRDRPLEAAKNLAVLPIALRFGALGRARGITHWHGHWTNVPTTACWYLGEIEGASWSAAIHGEDIFTPNRFLARKLDAAAFSVVCSGRFLRHLRGSLGLAAPERVHLNYHGLDRRVTGRVAAPGRLRARDASAAARLVSIGRLVPTKGHDTLIRAVSRLAAAGRDVTLEIVGDGPLERALAEQAASAGLAEAVRLRGALDFESVLATLERADVFCLAPRLVPGQPPDAIPNVIAEAMALGVPVVATRVSAIPELVIDGESGRLVAVDDDAALAAAIVELLDDRGLAARLALGARERVAVLFDQERNIGELLSLFRRHVPGRVLAETAHAASAVPRLAFVIEALTVGGAEQMLVGLANRCRARGWQVHVICLTAPGELASTLRDDVALHVLGKRPRVDPALPPRLRALIRRIAPQVINSHLWVANFWTRVSLVGVGVPIIVTEHSRDSWKPRHYRALDRWLERFTHALVAVSEDTARFYRHEIGVRSELVRVINNGIDTRRFAGSDGQGLRALWAPAGELLIGTVGRLVAAKNHLRLLDAFVLLRASGVGPLRLVIVGEGPERGALERRVAELGLGRAVVLAGRREDIPDVLAAFDLFVLSSDREGHPLTALEAQAAGTPVVLTDAGGAADAIAREGDEAGGILVERDATALAAALRRLIEDPGLRARMAVFAQRHALAHFDGERMVEAYATLFEMASPARFVADRA